MQAKKIVAAVVGNCIIHLIKIFSVLLRDNNMFSNIIMEQKLYKIKRAHTSISIYSRFFEWKLVAPIVGFNSRKEVSMDHLRL